MLAGSVAYYNPNNSTVDSQDFYNAFYKYWNLQQYTRFVVQTGNYSVINPVGGFHLQAACGGLNRALPFELDFGGSTFVFTVSSPVRRATASARATCPPSSREVLLGLHDRHGHSYPASAQS